MWFEQGLTKERLTQEYKKLVKRWHPDVNQDNVEEATKNMQEINNEYDTYFVKISYDETGYNADDLFDLYRRAREERRIILVFLKRDKQTSGWFSFNQYGKIMSDNSETWNKFHGGFALCQLKADVETYYGIFSWQKSEHVSNQQVSKLSSVIETPTYGDMYFASKWGGFNSMDISLTARGQEAHVSSYATFSKIHTEKYGDVWITRSARRGYDAYMRVNGQVMTCQFDLNPKFYEIVETVSGKDFGFLQFQNCTAEEFTEHFDVFYTPKFSESLNCRKLGKDELYFIDDPIVAHYARTGIVAFYCAERNFRMRYGKFNMRALFDNVHLLSYDDADRIQDYLDKMNVEFEEAVRGMIKKGKLKVKI